MYMYIVFVLQWEGDQLVREIFPEAIIFRPADIYGIKDWYFYKYIYHRKYNKSIAQQCMFGTITFLFNGV